MLCAWNDPIQQRRSFFLRRVRAIKVGCATRDSLEAARALGLTPIPAEARGLDALEHAFATMVGERAQSFVLLGDAVLFHYRGQIAAMALRNRLPAAATLREDAEAGYLVTYGADFRDLSRRSAVFVDKIFKAAKPGDLPVEQQTKFE